MHDISPLPLKLTPLQAELLKSIIHNGNSTAADLCHVLGMSAPTIARQVNEMIDMGLLLEYGKLQTSEGRKPTLYGLNPQSGYFVGVDTLYDGVNIGMIDFRGDLVQLEANHDYVYENTEESLEKLCQVIADFIDHCGVDRKKVFNINVNISGRVNPETGYSYTIFNFSERPLSDYMSERIGRPVTIDNDTRSMAYGELMQGAAKGADDVLFVNLGWGLGLGIIIDGKLYTGHSGFAGELGHFHAFDNDILCHCGKKGCLETEASGRALVRKIKERVAAGESTTLKKEQLQNLRLDDCLNGIAHEDPLCLEVIEEIGTSLGTYIAGLINLFNPEEVVIGGAVAKAGNFLMHNIETAVLKYSLNLVNRDTRLTVSTLQDKAGVIGACLLARSRVLE